MSQAAPSDQLVAEAKLSLDLEESDCPMGCRRDDRLLLVGRDRLCKVPGRFSVVRCRNCGLVRTNPRPTRQSMGQYYPENYSPYLSSASSANEPHGRNGWRKIVGYPRTLVGKVSLEFRRRINTNCTLLPSLQPGRMLEIGCASGWFLDEMAALGWSTAGVEPSPSAGAAARQKGHPVFIGQLEDAPAPQEKYDLVVGWMVLEHLHDPATGLRKLYDWTKRGGWLAFSVPNFGSLEHHFGDSWYALDVPRHLYHFTPRTIIALLDRCGWQTRKLMHQKLLHNLIGTIAYQLEEFHWMPNVSAGLLSSINSARHDHWYGLLLPIASVAGALGQTGRMTIWAQRD